MNFRRLPKQRVDVLLPKPLEGRLRAARGRQSLSQLVASALCLLFDEDPRRYDLPPRSTPLGDSRTDPEGPTGRSGPAGGSPGGGWAR